MDLPYWQVDEVRVLYREVKLTGTTGKIERSADALQISLI